jgi:uncharacterized protein
MKKAAPFRRKPLTSLLVKPAGSSCNQACAYCFYRGKGGPGPRGGERRMSQAVLEEMIRQAFEQCGQGIGFGWQGGEPTLMGLEFFRKAAGLMVRWGRGKAVSNGLQTNGLLLDREWARFLREHHFLVGLSLDGPEHVHDRYRRLADGRGSWALVADRARMLLDEGVEVNAVAVVNDYSAAFADETYAFFKEMGLRHMQFIPCVETDPADPSRAAAFSAGAEAYGHFLCRLFDLWVDDFDAARPRPYIRLFESLFFRYVGRRPPDCSLLKECGTYLVVEADGGVYSCDFFVEERWRLGNVTEEKLERLLNSERQTRFGRVKAAVPGTCRACRWLDLCRGGCPKDRQRDPRDGGLDHFCLSYRMFFEHADSRLRDLAEAWKRAEAEKPG